jgi:ATP-dependent helicase/nuclease subunit A
VPDFGPVAPWGPLDKTIAPSGLGGAKVLPGDVIEGDKDQAMARGGLIHALLEHLPLWPANEQARIGQALIDAVPDDVGDTTGLVDDAIRLLGLPHLAHLFGPDTLAEVGITATLADLGGARLRGTIDRLIVMPDRILAVDFKTNRLVPADPAQTPEGLLRQMGAYRAALAQIYGDRDIEVAILWTATGELMPLSPEMTQPALGRVTIP